MGGARGPPPSMATNHKISLRCAGGEERKDSPPPGEGWMSQILTAVEAKRSAVFFIIGKRGQLRPRQWGGNVAGCPRHPGFPNT